MATASGYMNSDPITGDAQNKNELRNYLMAKLRSGEILNPCNWVYTSIFGNVNCSRLIRFTGYLVIQQCHLVGYGLHWGDENMGNTAKFTLKKMNLLIIIVAYTSSRGMDALNSITSTRNKVNYARGHYATNFSQVPVNVENELNAEIPGSYMLFQNYPNPFNPSTKISWQSPVSGHQTLKVYDVLGNEVATLVNEYRNAGSYEVDFNASSLSSGIYFYKLHAGSFVQTKKMILLK